MNLSKNISLLKDINTNTTALTSINSHNSDMSGNLSSISLNANQHTTQLTTISNNISLIKTDVDTLAKTKIIFNARLTDGTNDYLNIANYSGGNAINFYWSNNLGSTAYIYKYVFVYPETGEPTQSQLYHFTAWDSNIGALNQSETAYEAPYIVVSDNKDYMSNISAGAPKNTWATNNCFVFQKDFHECPIEIGISRKFGHYINANITSLSSDDPIGIIEGYYYS